MYELVSLVAESLALALASPPLKGQSRDARVMSGMQKAIAATRALHVGVVWLKGSGFFSCSSVAQVSISRSSPSRFAHLPPGTQVFHMALATPEPEAAREEGKHG